MTDEPRISEEHLNAFLDGELDKEDRDRVFDAIKEDNCIKADACELRTVREMLQHARDEGTQTFARGRLLAAVLAIGPVVAQTDSRADSAQGRPEFAQGEVQGVVTDDALTQCVVELRKAFGDSAQEAKIIKTVPKVGFCLVPPVTVLILLRDRPRPPCTMSKLKSSITLVAMRWPGSVQGTFKFDAMAGPIQELQYAGSLHRNWRMQSEFQHPYPCG